MLRLVLMALLVFISACDKNNSDPARQPSHEKWTEKVKLANGGFLDIKQERRHGGGEAGSFGGPLVYARIEFDYRGEHYVWESENVAPYILEIDERGRPVVAGDIGYDWAWRQRGSPCDRGVVQYSENGVWIQIPSWDLPVNNRLNIAQSKKQADAGMAMADDPRSPSTIMRYWVDKDKCTGKE